MTMTNSILSDHNFHCTNEGMFTDGGYNLQPGDDCLTDPTNVDGDAFLDDLAFYGGTTRTFAFEPESEAINQIPISTNDCGTVVVDDQRGETRPGFTNCDIGAYELVLSDTLCSSFPMTASNELELNTAFECFRYEVVAGEYSVTLTDNISLTATSLPIQTLRENISMHLDGAGFTIDGQNIFGIRPLEIKKATPVTIENITLTRGHSASTGGGIAAGHMVNVLLFGVIHMREIKVAPGAD